MKISKLFHWLYAFLMFLPIVFFIPNALYYGFNEHATNSETTTINYKYQSNEVNSYDDLELGNIYELEINELGIDDFLQQDGTLVFTLLNDLYLDTESILSVNADYDIPFFSSNTILQFYLDMNGAHIFTYYSYEQFENTSWNMEYLFDGVFNSNCIGQLYYHNDVIQSANIFTYTDYNVIESVEINTNDTISNKMYQAWQSTWNLPLLQWTHTSFVAQPFTYITGLFGVPSDSTLNYIFAYFVSISICWLVFDLIMYVPNLVHRWLDRSALE